MELKVKCDNADNGCEWIGELRSLDQHSNDCDYTFLSCPNECENGDKILRKDMEKHKMEECSRRQYVCPHCEESGKYEERTTTHHEECPLMKIPCSNNGCCELVARCNFTSHYDECEFVVVACKYAEIGCKVEVLRKDLKKHKEDRQQHLELAVDAVPELHAALKSLNFVELPKLEQKIVQERGALEGEVSRIKDSVSKCKALLELQEMVKKQENILAQLQSIITAQSKEISELKVKLNAASSNDVPELCATPVAVRTNPISTQIYLNVFKFTKYAE